MLNIHCINMNWKNILAFSFSLLYLILISLFIYFSKVEIVCGFNNPCLRFCSSDTEKYSNKILYDEFLASNFSQWFDETDFDRVNFFRGPLLCNGKIKQLEVVQDEDDEYGDTMIDGRCCQFTYGYNNFDNAA